MLYPFFERDINYGYTRIIRLNIFGYPPPPTMVNKHPRIFACTRCGVTAYTLGSTTGVWPQSGEV